MRKKTTQKKSKKQRILNFVKYNNGFPFIVGILLVGTSTFAATDPGAVVSSQQTVVSVDNSRIISVDLSNFNQNLQIKGITEDADNYYVDYTYDSIVIQDNAWQDAVVENTMTIDKASLRGGDLGTWLAGKLSDVLAYDLSYLKKVQQEEKQNGQTNKVVSTTYSGLVGKFLNPKQETFPGYVPTVTPPTPPISVNAVTPAPVTPAPNLQALIDQAVQAALAAEKQNSSGGGSGSGGSTGDTGSGSTSTGSSGTGTTSGGDGSGSGDTGGNGSTGTASSTDTGGSGDTGTTTSGTTGNSGGSTSTTTSTGSGDTGSTGDTGSGSTSTGSGTGTTGGDDGSGSTGDTGSNPAPTDPTTPPSDPSTPPADPSSSQSSSAPAAAASAVTPAATAPSSASPGN
jgi:hypothetical protein